MESQVRPPYVYECDKNLRRLVRGDKVAYREQSYVFVELAEPLGLAYIEDLSGELVYAPVVELEIID